MILRFDIPGGNMVINVEDFMAGAGVRRIRKMLKLYDQSCPDAEEVQHLKDFLLEMVEQSKNEERAAKDEYKKADAEVGQRKAVCDYLKMMGTEVFPDQKREWRKKLSDARSALVKSKERRNDVKRAEIKALKRWKAYMDALVEIEKVMGGGGK